MISVRPFAETDLSGVAKVHAAAFPRQPRSRLWIECHARAYPLHRYFVAEAQNEILGFVLWGEKSGFREEAVLELEQIGVLPKHQGKGIGTALIRESLPVVADELAERGASLKALLVTTRADNKAQRLYETVLGAKVEATLAGLYSGDEVIMVSRRPLDKLIRSRGDSAHLPGDGLNRRAD